MKNLCHANSLSNVLSPLIRTGYFYGNFRRLIRFFLYFSLRFGGDSLKKKIQLIYCTRNHFEFASETGISKLFTKVLILEQKNSDQKCTFEFLSYIALFKYSSSEFISVRLRCTIFELLWKTKTK